MLGNEEVKEVRALAQVLEPELHNLLFGPTKEAGDFLQGLMSLPGFAGRRLSQLFGYLDGQFKKGQTCFPESVKEGNRERIQRTIYAAAFSVGQDLLEYWGGIIAYQANATDSQELDFSETIVSTLKEMTDTHGEFLRDFANALDFDFSKIVKLRGHSDSEKASEIKEMLGTDCGLRLITINEEDIGRMLPNWPLDRANVLLGDLKRLGPLGHYTAGSGHGFTYYYLTLHGIELLRLGGWKPDTGFGA